MNHCLAEVVYRVGSIVLARWTWALPWGGSCGSLSTCAACLVSSVPRKGTVERRLAVPVISVWLTYDRMHIYDLFKKSETVQLRDIFRTWKPEASWVYSSGQKVIVWTFLYSNIWKALWNIKAWHATEIQLVSVCALVRTTGQFRTPASQWNFREKSSVSMSLTSKGFSRALMVPVYRVWPARHLPQA